MILKENFPNQGFGTDQIPNGDVTYSAVKYAIEAGYRLIDNADCYYNEESVGKAISECIKNNIVSRDELIITNKVPDWKQGYDATIKCCKASLKRTGLEYFDLYLIHSPLRQYENWKEKIIDTYRALEYLYKEGLVKRIGVSNFAVRHLEFILGEAEIKPFCNQIEFHPQRQQKEVVRFCKDNDLLVEGWGTLNQGRIFNNETFKSIAAKYDKTISQIAVQYSIQSGVIPLVRSAKKERILENYSKNDFKIKDEDMNILSSLDGGEFSNWHHDGIKPPKMIPAGSKEHQPAKYRKTWKLFNFIPIVTTEKHNWNKTKVKIFGIHLITIRTKDL